MVLRPGSCGPGGPNSPAIAPCVDRWRDMPLVKSPDRIDSGARGQSTTRCCSNQCLLNLLLRQPTLVRSPDAPESSGVHGHCRNHHRAFLRKSIPELLHLPQLTEYPVLRRKPEAAYPLIRGSLTGKHPVPWPPGNTCRLIQDHQDGHNIVRFDNSVVHDYYRFPSADGKSQAPPPDCLSGLELHASTCQMSLHLYH